ncbi:MAG: hypothetical protein ACP5NQ_04255, partial [Vulcanisaeta sp.]
MSTPTLSLNSLPPIFASRLIHSLLSRFLAGGGLEYEDSTGIIKCVDCNEFRRRLHDYVKSRKLDDVLRWSFGPVDGISSGECLGRGMGKVQDFVKSLIQDSGFNVMNVFYELSQVSILKSGNEVIIRWGSDNYRWIPFYKTPPIVSSVDLMEGAKVWPAALLDVAGKGSRVRV